MAITDINISEELMTDAPSIKYRGNEGPKSPEQEQMMMVDDVLDEAYEQYIYDLLENNELESNYQLNVIDANLDGADEHLVGVKHIEP